MTTPKAKPPKRPTTKKPPIAAVPEQPEVEYIAYPKPYIEQVVNVLHALPMPPKDMTCGQLDEIKMQLLRGGKECTVKE